MFGIPQRCCVKQFIAKKNFLNFADLNKTEKEDLSSSVRKITLLFQLEPNNINVSPYEDEVREYPLINIFHIEVEQNANTKRIAGFIMSAIPSPSVLIFQNDDQMQLAVAHQRTNQNDSSKNVLEEIILSKWQTYNENLFNINEMNLQNFFALYSDIVDLISIQNAKAVDVISAKNKNATGEQARALLDQYNAKETEIAALRAQLKKETQFNRKIELNIRIKKLEKELQEL